MIISSLCNLYDILVKDPDSEIALYGFSRAKVSFQFKINSEGRLTAIIPLSDEISTGKKTKSVQKTLIVPQQVKRASDISPNFLCDKIDYVTGLANIKEAEKRTHNRAQEQFESFKQLHNDILGGLENRYSQAFLRFLNEFDYDTYSEIIDPHKEALFGGGMIVFEVDGVYLHEVDEIKDAWLNRVYFLLDSSVRMQCAVCGKVEPIARLHPSIKGVRDAQSSGASLVSFNCNSADSFNKDRLQGLNAPISETVTFKYTTVLNHLLASNKNRVQIGDATTVFWAESSKEDYVDYLNFFINPSEDNSDNKKNEEEGEVKSVIALETQKKIKTLLEAYKTGKTVDFNQYDLDKDTTIYILGISPNVSRLSIRFFYKDSFEGILSKMSLHYADLAIEKSYENQPDNIPVWQLIRETYNSNSKSGPSPLLAGSITRAIISGEMYPMLLFNSVIGRIRCDRSINYVRASVIKAFLCRYARIHNNNKLKEVLSMSLNEATNNTAYLLGRLFAILEVLQKNANPGINATIKDRYFSSACATPASVFPTLLKLAQNHLKKLEGKKYEKKISEIEKKISEIFEKLDGVSMPNNLTLEEQGIFIIGYYHQNNDFYKKAEDKETQKEANQEEI
ncbi:MAG TPA: type I-C CRISPR-associated protein Cas8c/Csd1 [Clostridia bacterium]|nr:type I-C CRISPR-associated protein Cas8c/Csd1 [Clostridia bacterium]